MDDLFLSLLGHFLFLFLLPFVMYVSLNGAFAYDKEIENVFGRCRLIKYLLPFLSTLILYFLIVVFIELFNNGLVPRIKYPSLRFFLDTVIGPPFGLILVSCLYSFIVYGWCWVGKCVKNVFGRRGLIIYCVISIILAIIAIIAIMAYIIPRLL